MGAGKNRPVRTVVFLVWLMVAMAIGGAAMVIFRPPPAPPPPPSDEFVAIPFITWGGDAATFYANGGLKTQRGALYDKLGLKIRLVNGDDFNAQVKDYLDGKSDFLRGTFSMLGLASEKINSSPQNQAVVFLQVSWSAGDHMVAREGLKTLNELKGRKIALQKDGPHVGMLHDTLRTADLTWRDITPVWVDDLTGDKGPAARFRSDPSVDACFVIPPDMVALTGGLGSVGSGSDQSVRGAHVLNSTAWMSRSICDVYACRKRFFDANHDFVEKFTAGFLKASEDVVRMARDHEDKRTSPKYAALLKLSTGKDYFAAAAPKEDDVHGMIMDCFFVRLPGNFSFFTLDSNRSGFKFMQAEVLAMARELGEATTEKPFAKVDFNEASYEKIKGIGGISDPVIPPSPPPIIVPDELLSSREELDKITAYSFTIPFKENRSDFPMDEYGDSFQRAIDTASLWGHAALVVRGHADPGNALKAFVVAGLKTGDLQRAGVPGGFVYTWKPTAETLDLGNTPRIVQLIKQMVKERPEYNEADLQVGECLRLAESRVNAVRDGCVEYAKSVKLDLNPTQIKVKAIGILEPLVPKPRTQQDLEKNCRGEFRLIKVPLESVPKDVF